MAHFAELDENNVVIRVVVINDSDCLNDNGQESEAVGVAFCQELFGGGTWKQTSYNKNIRGNFAGVGMIYNETGDYFYVSKPSDFPSFVWDDSTKGWTFPVAEPTTDRNLYRWDEATVSWVLKTNPPSQAD